MPKISFLSIFFLSLFLSSCGFHTPYKSSDINANIISSENNLFVNALTKRFNKDSNKSFSITIGDENKTKQNSSFNSSGTVASYTLTLAVNVEVYNRDNVLLIKEELHASSHHSVLSSTQADKLQIDEAYSNLRNTLIKKLLRRMYRLDED